MKKVLFITTRLIYPINDGRKVVLYNYCKGLVEQHNCEVRLFSLVDAEEKNKKQPEFISKVYYANQPSKSEKIKNLFVKSVLFNKWPLQVSLYYSKTAKDKLNNVIDEYKPDILICDMARTAEYINDLDCSSYNKILDMDDILSKRYKRQVDTGIMNSNSIGAYSKKLPTFVNKFLNNKTIIKFVLNKESKLLYNYESYISRYYKSIVFVSPIEANEFNKRIGINKSIDITIGVDYNYFSKNVIKQKKENYLVFLGNMYVAHNKDSINEFIKNIFPKILEENPMCKLRIVGRCSEEYKCELEKNKNIEVTGEVDDIRRYVQECTLAIAPLLYGSGIKTKILETMAMGVPVITNTIGIEGIDVINNKQIFVCNDEYEFKEKIIELLDNQKLRETVTEEAQNLILNKYRWDNILDKFKEIL